jgi:hypothetical protein
MFSSTLNRISAALTFLVIFCVLAGDFAPAQDAKKDASATNDSKDAKKAPKLTPISPMVGKILKMEDGGFKLEVGAGRLKQTLEIQLGEDLKVRLPVTVDFDDKGHPKKAKKDPNDKDAKLGGIKGSPSDLGRNQQVEVMGGRLPNHKVVATTIKILKLPEK